MNSYSDLNKAPVFWSCRLTVVISAVLHIINVVFARISFNFCNLCMAYDPSKPRSANKMVQYNEKHGVGTFEWSKEMVGFLLSSYFIGYVSSCFIGGLISDVWGGRKPLLWGNGFQVLFFILQVPSVYLDPYLFWVARTCCGFFSGISFAPIYYFIGKWTHPSERVLLMGITFCGFPFATVLTYPMAEMFCRYGFRGWESNFYFPGIFGLFNQFIFYFFMYDSPRKHPRISERERAYLTACDFSSPKPKDFPWCLILKSMSIWAYIISHTAQVWNWQSLAINMPLLYKEIFQLQGIAAAIASSLPFLGLLFVRIFISIAFRKVFVWSGVTLTRFRKINHLIGTIVPAIGLIVATILHESHWIIAVILMVIILSAADFAISAGFLPSLLDIAPQYSATISGLSTTVAFCSSVLSPLLTGYVTKNQTKAEWNTVLYIQAGILLFSCIVYELFGSSERLHWAIDKQIPSPHVERSMSGGIDKDASLRTMPLTPMLSVPSFYGITDPRIMAQGSLHNTQSEYTIRII